MSEGGNVNEKERSYEGDGKKCSIATATRLKKN